MATAYRYEDLDCWQLSNELKEGVYRASAFPGFGNKRLRQQIRDSAASVTSNIAEGFGRHSNADFLNFLDIARGSLNETQNHLQDALMQSLIARTEYDALLVLSKRTAGAVAGLQRYLRARVQRSRGKAGIPFNPRTSPESKASGHKQPVNRKRQ
jgi:four helix bundle protein